MSFATRAMSSPREQTEHVKFSNGDSTDYNNNIEFSSSSFNFPAVGNTNDLNMSSKASRTDYNDIAPNFSTQSEEPMSITDRYLTLNTGSKTIEDQHGLFSKLQTASKFAPKVSTSAPQSKAAQRQMSTHSEALTDHKTHISTHAEALTDHKTHITTHAEALTDHKTHISTHAEALTDHKTHITTHAEALTDHKTHITTHAEALTDHQTHIRMQSEALNDHKAHIETSMEALNDHNTTISELNNTVKSQNLQISMLKNDIKKLSIAANSHEKDINRLNTSHNSHLNHVQDCFKTMADQTASGFTKIHELVQQKGQH